MTMEPGDASRGAATLAEARGRFDAAGYRLEFEAAEGQLWCRGCGQRAHPADVVVEAVAAVARSDGSAAGELYALDCLTWGIKGVWWSPATAPTKLRSSVGSAVLAASPRPHHPPQSVA